METVCLTCGNQGFPHALIYCFSCEAYAVHRYCLDVLPETFEEYVIWYCMDCKPSSSRSDIIEIDQTARLGYVLKKKERMKKLEWNEVVNNERKVCSGSINKIEQRCGRHERSHEDYADSVRSEIAPVALKDHSDSLEQCALKYSEMDAGNSDKETESGVIKASDVAMDNPLDIPKCNSFVAAQPIIEPIWRGCLSLNDKSFGTVDGLVAHVSSLACFKVCEVARSLPWLLSTKLHRRSDIWPRSFQMKGPGDDSIALYFFPASPREEKAFDTLVDEMMEGDLAMKFVLNNAELLLFPSFVLPMQHRRFQSKFYLWGVFKGKQASSHRTVPCGVPEGFSELC